MDRLEYAFVIFFITLGPIKCMGPFLHATARFDAATKHKIALQGTLIATAVGLFIVFVADRLRTNWEVAQPDLLITFGVLLMIAALRQLHNTDEPTPAAPPPEDPKGIALSPIAFPTIITPYGVVALLVFAAVASTTQTFLFGIFGIFLLMMLLDYLAMIFAKQILAFIRPQVLQAFGWVLAVLQASLAIHAITSGLGMGLLSGLGGGL